MNKKNTKNIEETKRSHVESMELANKEIDELADKIARLDEIVLKIIRGEKV